MKSSMLAVVRVALGLLLVTGAAFSIPGLTNGNFTGGSLAGWSTLGSVSAVGTQGNIVPVSGSYQALVGSGSDGSGDLKGKARTAGSHAARPKPAAHPINPKTGDPNFPDVPEATLESTLGLAPGAIGVALPDLYTPTNGSVIYQTFAATAGNTLSFYWNFVSNEVIPSQWDAALYSLKFGSNAAQLVDLADTTQSSVVNQDPGVASNFAEMTGYKQTSIVLPSTGTYTIAFYSMQTGDDSVASATFISNVALNGTSLPPTPAPSSWTLLALGLGALAVYSGVRQYLRAN